MTTFMTTLTLNHFSGSGKKGIIRGFSVAVVVEEENQTTLTVSPGIAVDGRGRLIVLPTEQQIPLPEEPVDFSVAFGVAYDEPVQPYAKTDDGLREAPDAEDHLGHFRQYTCRIGYVNVEEVETDDGFVELARVGQAGTLAAVRPPADPLRPALNELDTRDACWLGETDVGFLRRDLQHALAKEVEEILVQWGKSGRLGTLGSDMYKAFTLLPVPAFCHRGLLARDQFIQFLEVAQQFRHGPAKAWDAYSNGQLVAQFLALKDSTMNEEYVSLNKDRFEAPIPLGKGRGATVNMRYESGLHTFRLHLHKGQDGIIRFEPTYTNPVAGKKIMHTWNGSNNQMSVFAQKTIPASLELYSVDPRRPARREQFVRCTFKQRGEKVVYVAMRDVNKNLWPVDSNA